MHTHSITAYILRMCFYGQYMTHVHVLKCGHVCVHVCVCCVVCMVVLVHLCIGAVLLNKVQHIRRHVPVLA